MRTKIVLFVVLGLALLLGACASAEQPSQEAPRTLNVTGSARVEVQPDIAYITIGVQTENADAAEAVAENNRQSQAIIAALTAQGVEEKDIQTRGFNIFPQDEFDPEGKRIGTRFVVENTVSVTVRELDAIGELLSAAVEAGANTIRGVQFDLTDKASVIAEARKQAVADAKAQAEELAAAAGVTLGEVQSLSYYNAYPVPVDNKVAYGVGGGAGESVPISPGQLTFIVEVSLSYIIR